MKTPNPLHRNINMHSLHTVYYVFPKVPTGRICVTVKDFFTCWSIPLFLWPKYVIQRWYCKEKLDASHSWGTGFIIMPFLKHLWFFLNPNNSMHILHTVLFAFPKVLVGRIKQFRAFLVTNHFLNSCDLNVWFRHGSVRTN